MPLESLNPATGERIAIYQEHSASEIDARLNNAERAFRGWRDVPFAERSMFMARAAGLLRDRAGKYAALMTAEMGKPVAEAAGEVKKCAGGCDYYAENSERILAPRVVPTDAAESYVRYDPIGPILAIMPWNFPFWQVIRFAAPGLMAGNVCVLKHSSNVQGCALALERLFKDAGFPEGVFQTLVIPSSATEAVIKDPRIRGVTLTGSCEAGRRVASAAGAALKKTVLELGGSDPFLVLADADLEKAAKVGAYARIYNCGQVCIASKRFIVEKKAAGEFAKLFKRELENVKVGDPMDPATQMGPMARLDLRQALQDQVQRSIKEGAELELGGAIPKGPGAYYPPTLLKEVRPGNPAADEEVFGPVAALMVAENEDDAVAMANSSRFGLGSSVWTSNPEKGRAVARRIESGMVFINSMTKSDPKLPFGGVKESGYGRELSDEGIREFCNIKTVWRER
jgi:succinate-semialdehyde dehydrogenase/glutarate-semialdehyde dehydrogenase